MAKSTSVPDPSSPREPADDASPPHAEASSDFLPKKGERALSIGQTGSGKTTFNRWLLERLPETPIVIYDTKYEPKFEQLPKHRIVNDMDEAQAAIDDLGIDYVVFRPPPFINSNWKALDRLLAFHEENWHGIDAYIDELYHFHNHGVAGPGLNGLYTRGRGRGITTVASTQRPAWISSFALSETQLFYVFYLALKDDLKKISGFIPDFDSLERPDGHSFYVYRQGSRKVPELHSPVPVAKNEDLGYTDHLKKPEAADSDDVPEVSGHSTNVWI